MSDYIDRIRDQAMRDASDFWDNHDMSEILKRYAYVSNRMYSEFELLTKKKNRGYRLKERDWEDYEYYTRYREMLAVWIANSELSKNGYEQDEDGKWNK